MKNIKQKAQSQRSATLNKVSLKGKGDYNVSSNEFSALQSKLDRIENKIPDVKSGLASVGSKVGSLFGASELGRQAGSGLSKLMGFGDYTIMSNSLMKGNSASEAFVPKFDNKGTNGIRVREREFLGNIVSSSSVGAFNNVTYPLTPTSSMTFPWLSTVASQFDQWEPNGIVFEFVTTSSDFNGSAQGLGSITMATDYDVLDAPYTSKVVMANADYSSSCKPSVNQYHGIECDPMQRPYRTMYTRSLARGLLNNNTLGLFQVASTGVSAASVTLGELWVSYDITFYKKQLDTDLVPSFTINGSYDSGTASWTVNTTTNHVGWSTATIPSATNQLRINFPPGVDSGRYMVQIYQTVYSGINPPGVASTGTTSTEVRASTISPGNPWLWNGLFNVSTFNASIVLAFNISSGFEVSLTQVPSDFNI